MRKQTRKPTTPAFKIEAFTNGQWLWVIMPDFKTREEADAYVVNAEARTPGSTYRVVGA